MSSSDSWSVSTSAPATVSLRRRTYSDSGMPASAEDIRRRWYSEVAARRASSATSTCWSRRSSMCSRIWLRRSSTPVSFLDDAHHARKRAPPPTRHAVPDRVGWGRVSPGTRLGPPPALPGGAVLGQGVGDQGVGVAVAQAVFCLEPGDEFHVPGERRRADEVLPLGDRAPVLLLDGREITGGSLRGVGGHAVPRLRFGVRVSVCSCSCSWCLRLCSRCSCLCLV